MLRAAIPVLHVTSAAGAEDFYCGRLRFRREFAYRADENRADPCYFGLKRDECQIHLSSFSGDGISGGVVYLPVDDVDELFRELGGLDVAIDLAPTDQTWGNREMYVTDPDGNSLRFIQAGDRRST